MMHKTYILLIFSFSLICNSGYSLSDPNINYRADSIREELKKDAHSVKRYEKVEIEVSSPDKVTMHTREIITILDKKAAGELNFVVNTSKFRILEDADIRLFDKDGKVIEKYKKKDLSSQASGSGLVEDGYVYFLELSTANYPVTIERDYTFRLRGLYQIPAFYFSQPDQSVEYSSFLISYPSSMKVNFKTFRINEKPVWTNTDNMESVQWETRNLPSVKNEDGSGPWINYFPHILFNSDKIDYDGYTGNLSTWKDMGLWYNKLVGNANRLSPANQEDIRKLVAGAGSDSEKICILYKNLQNNFRYVSIQLGIGGFKPFPADFVHEKKYGDCKGLSNYMEACLDAIHIKGYSAWVKSGDECTFFEPEFAHDGFDHQILVVPQGKDTIWLECTSNYNEFGHLGSFTENRYALMLTENGGQLIKTPVSKAKDNIISASTLVDIGLEGDGTIHSSFTSTGEYKYAFVNLSRESADLQKQYAVRYFGLINPDEFKISFDKQEKKPYTCSLEIRQQKIYDFKTGTKMFIRPRMTRIWQFTLNPADKRLQDYYLSNPLIKSDTTRFQLPEGLTVESLPMDKKISFSQGSYSSSYRMDDKSRTIFSVATLIINAYKIEPGQYDEARKFFDQVLEDGNQKIILKNSQ